MANKKSPLRRFAEMVAEMKVEGECLKCGHIEDDPPDGPGEPCPKCSDGELFYLSIEDGLDTVNGLIFSAREALREKAA